MHTLDILRALARTDGATIRRDSLLRAMIFVPLGLAAAARWLVPPQLEQLSALFDVDLAAWYPLLVGYVLLLLPPLISGMVVGFLLLDTRDEHTLDALRVTPLPLAGYLVYRLSLPLLLSIAVTLLAFPLAGVVMLRMDQLVLVACLAAPMAPLAALFVAAFAANKVQGFALQKLLGIAIVAPLIGMLAPAPWRWLAGIIPTFWPASVLWALQHAHTTEWWMVLMSICYTLLLLWLLLRRWQAHLEYTVGHG